MIELHVTLVVAAAVAAVLTGRITPANAQRAHRLWLVVLASPFLWLAGASLFAPVLTVGFKPGVLPAGVLAGDGASRWMLPAIYVAVASALLLRTAVAAWAVLHLIRDSQRLEGAELAHLRSIAGDGALDIREGSVALPVTAGFFRPVVILPSGWREFQPGGLAAILRHEAAHVRRRDCLTALVAAVLEALLWFNPAVWIATSRVRWFAEMACDSDAARHMDGEVYASELLALAAGWGAARRPHFTITAGAETGVARRIRLLLDEIEQGWRKRLLLPVAALVLIVAIPVAAKIRVGPTGAAAAPGTFFSHGPAHHVSGHGH